MEPTFVPYRPDRYSPEETLQRAEAFRDLMAGRRSVRCFSREDVPREVIARLLATAASAPSGANKQPWTFVAVHDAAVKGRIREAAEQEEKRFYGELAPDEWLRDLAPFGTDWVKTHIADPPWVIVVFAQDFALHEDGSKSKHYYVNESVGIAVGLLIAAIRNAGLAALTHTPAPMEFLKRELGRPPNERAFVLIPVGYPAADAKVPDIRRKPSSETVVWVEGPQ
jgi:nitroreductase